MKLLLKFKEEYNSIKLFKDLVFDKLKVKCIFLVTLSKMFYIHKQNKITYL